MENAENIKEMENINQMTQNTLIMIQNIWFLTRKTLFDHQKTQNTLYGFYVTGRKIIKYTLREHDPGSA